MSQPVSLKSWPLLLLLGLVAVPATAVLAANAPVPLSAILEAWQARQNNVKSYEFSWTSTEFQGAHSIIVNNGPETDASFDAKATYILDGTGRFRLDYVGMEYSPTKRSHVPVTTIDENDGSKRISFFPNGIQDFPNAQISADPDSESANVSQTLPVRLVYRTTDPIFGVVGTENLAVTESSTIVNGMECIGVRQASSKNSPLDILILVDPSKKYIPVKYEARFQGRPIAQATISSFVRDEIYGWVPEEWTLGAKFDKSGSPSWSDSVVVTKSRINHPLPADVFEIQFPVGTWVQNNITNEAYIVRENGGKRLILPGEFNGTNYRELLESEPGPVRRRAWSLYFIGGNIAAIAVIIYLMVRRRSARIRAEGL